MKPICYDLYCGLGGWAQGFLSEGYRCIGYDIEKHDYGTGTYPGELILCDVRSIHGSQLADAACIVASPPCQEPSYRAMPWKRAKTLNAIGPPHNFIELFNTCFRIQREASEAAGHYIPMIVENVRGAEKWVGPARWHFGSFYLWGDVPALMPPTFRGVKVPGLAPGCFPPGGLAQGHIDQGKKHARGVSGGPWFSNKAEAEENRKVRGLPPRNDGIKSPGTKLSEVGFNVRNAQRFDSRKAASAEIAKIPFPLAQHIARCFKPRSERECAS